MPANSNEPRWHGEHKPDVNPAEFVINSQEYERVAYGDGQDDLDDPECNACGVPQGALHKLGCQREPCPRCGGPAVTCDCSYEDD